MSIASEITRINNNISAAYTAVSNKGGTLPQTQNSANLATAIGTISGGGGSGEGIFTENSPTVITHYDNLAFTICGTNFGTNGGKVLILDRESNAYVDLNDYGIHITDWDNQHITFDDSIFNYSVSFCGSTSIVVQPLKTSGTPNVYYPESNRFLVESNIPVSGWGIVYYKDALGNYQNYTITSKNDFKSIMTNVTSNVAFNRPVTIALDEITIDDIVGFQFGEDFTYESNLLSGFCNCYVNFDQPIVFPEKAFYSTGNGCSVCFNACHKFNQPIKFNDNDNNIKIYTNSFSNLLSFNQPFDLSKFSKVGTSFFAYNSSFNQPLDASNITSIGTYFMQYCSSFNQPLTINSSVVQTPSNFLSYCQSFNSPITFNGTITKYGNYFLAGNYNFNQSVPSSTVTSIGTNFLYNCYNFNKPITINSSLTNIQPYFMSGCRSFNQEITIPSTVTFVGQYFMNNCMSLQSIIVNTEECPTDDYSLSNGSNYCFPAAFGLEVKGTESTTWCTALPDKSQSSPSLYRRLIDAGS